MDKFFLASRTIQGILLAAIPTVCQLFGWDWSEDDTNALGGVLEHVITGVGLVWAFIGRWRADKPLKAAPGPGVPNDDAGA